MVRFLALSLLMIPPVQNVSMDAPKEILVHAHRGGRAFRPENTIPAFKYGISVGADVLELDLAVTKDNVLVVSHSPFLTQPSGAPVFANERQCGGPPLPPGTYIHSLTLAQLKQYDCGTSTLAAFPTQVAVPQTTIPTFDEVLDLAPMGKFDFNVETKIFPNHPEFTPSPEKFVELIDAAIARRHLQSRIILQSFDFRTLRVMRKLDPAIRLSALFGQAKYDTMMGLTDGNKSFEHVAESAQLRPGDFFSPDMSLVTPAEVSWAHEHKFRVAPYTVNKPQGWAEMAAANVDAIITDDPQGLLDWLRKQKPPLHQ